MPWYIGRERVAESGWVLRRLPVGGQQGQLGRVNTPYDPTLRLQRHVGVHRTREHVRLRGTSRRRVEPAHDRLRKCTCVVVCVGLDVRPN